MVFFYQVTNPLAVLVIGGINILSLDGYQACPLMNNHRRFPPFPRRVGDWNCLKHSLGNPKIINNDNITYKE